MPACTFCKLNYEWPRGMSVVQKDGSVKFFCSGKCRKSSEMGRDNKKVTWVRKLKENKAEQLKKAEKREKNRK